MSYDSFLEEYRVACLKAYEHRVLPFDYLIQQLDVPRQTSHSLFSKSQSTIRFMDRLPNPTLMSSSSPNMILQRKDAVRLCPRNRRNVSGELVCSWDFDEALYDEARMSDLRRRTGSSSIISYQRWRCEAGRVATYIGNGSCHDCF